MEYGKNTVCVYYKIKNGEYNAKFNVPTKRPEYSSLRNLALECTVGNEMRDWEIALKEYITNLEKLNLED